MAVKEEQHKRIQEAMVLKPAPSEDNFETKAMKAMGAMEDGDALFGSGAEVNLDSQVTCLCYYVISFCQMSLNDCRYL